MRTILVITVGASLYKFCDDKEIKAEQCGDITHEEGYNIQSLEDSQALTYEENETIYKSGECEAPPFLGSDNPKLAGVNKRPRQADYG